MLQTVGGFDIAGLTGVFIGGAMYHVPIVLDGLISGAAALLAKRIIPGTEHFMIASHLGKRTGGKGNFKRNRDQASHPWRSGAWRRNRCSYGIFAS